MTEVIDSEMFSKMLFNLELCEPQQITLHLTTLISDAVDSPTDTNLLATEDREILLFSLFILK